MKPYSILRKKIQNDKKKKNKKIEPGDFFSKK